jgi:pyrimidine operon attenuation protein/uracil phosphoribosyltransferase
MSAATLDAQVLYQALLHHMRQVLKPGMQLLGIASGGAWLAERLHQDLQLPQPVSVISSSLHRDDFAQRGISASVQTQIGFAVNHAHIVLLDDVLHTGRTVRAVLNELYDFGRPACVQLAVLVERHGRELPIQADWCAAQVTLAANQSLALARDAAGRFRFNLQPR